MSNVNGTTAPVNGSAVPFDQWLPTTKLLVPALAEPQHEDPDSRVTLLRQQVEIATELVAIQDDPALTLVLSEKERDARVAQAVRHRKDELGEAHRAHKDRMFRQARLRRSQARQDKISDRQELWGKRALARRQRLLDPTSRLAGLHRTHTIINLVLFGLITAGVAWTSVGVHDALVGPNGTWLAYAVEPLFSVPLLVIMALQARAAQWGRKFPPADKQKLVHWIKGVLVGATITLNTSPVLPGLGTWKDTATLLAHLAPPLLITLVVVLQPLASAFVGEVLVEAHIDLKEGAGRLSADTTDTLTLARRIQEDWQLGDLRESTDGGPSITHARDRYGIGKQRAQVAVDAWRVLYQS